MANLVRNTTKFDSSVLFKANDRDLLSPIGKQFAGLYFSWGIPGDSQTRTVIYAVKFEGAKGKYTELALVVGNQFTIAPFLQNHESLFGDNQATAQKALEAYFKKYATLDRLSDGRVSAVDFATSIAEAATAAGYSQESIAGFISAILSSESMFFGPDVTKYYELPTLRKALPASASEQSEATESTASEATIDIAATEAVTPAKQKALTVDQLLELDRSSLSKDSIVRILTELGVEFDSKADKSSLLALLG